MLPIYRDTGSRIHKLHPYVMSAFSISIFLSSMLTESILYLSLLFIITVAVAASARIIRVWSSMIRFAIYLSLSILVIDLFLLPADTWWKIYAISIPVEPVTASISLILRLLVSISAFLILSLTVNPDEIFNAVTSSKIVLALAMGTRLYPLLASDEQEIEDIMRVRGVELDAGGRIEKIRNRGFLLLPLLINSLERGLGMAESMESRSFSARKRGVSAFYRPPSPYEKILFASQILAFVLAFLWMLVPHSLFPYLLLDIPSLALSPAALLSLLLYLSVIPGGGV